MKFKNVELAASLVLVLNVIVTVRGRLNFSEKIMFSGFVVYYLVLAWNTYQYRLFVEDFVKKLKDLVNDLHEREKTQLDNKE
jgi:hypothetical protein